MNKVTHIEEAIAAIPSGAVVMVGGFGSPGTPFSLINELLRQGQKHLTLIKNDANEAGIGISKLIEAGRVDRLITTHIGLNKTAIEWMNTQRLEVEFHPQGMLAEKIRTAGAGSFGFLTDIGLGCEITREDQLLDWEGERYKVEMALKADFALIHAARSDRLGNLVYEGSAMNFSPLMAMAADQVIVETPECCEPGEIAPNQIHTPCAFVNSLVLLPLLTQEYAVMEHHVRH
ncbi:CoA transferase subunit A [Nitrincola alkalilacustris]|uniref:CoA transferase subunit A n=1 Tax=Nitrincola alkalilacustris TaxID=1571224 RepID=UPI00124C4539|nr:3-oxoacid CoA-transferase subunit A [Nitrincola alkalilacustris]